MDYVQGLQSFLKQQGFKKLKYDSRIFWVREEEKVAALVEIIPEWLPGQPRIATSKLEAEANMVAGKLMVRLGKRVERLTLMLCRDLPDERELKDTLEYPDIWWVDCKAGRVLIYENQKTNFFGMKDGLEEFLQKWNLMEKKQNQKEWNRMLQPVTLSLVAINVVVFILMSLTGDTEDPSFMARSGAMTWDSIVVERQYYRVFTAMFLHFGAEHLLQNMLVLLLTGTRMERALGKIRYLVIYLGAGLCSSLVSLLFTLKGTGNVAAGASGAIFGIMGGILFLVLKDKITGGRKYFAEIGLTGIIFMIACAASYGFFGAGVDNAAHIGGLIGGFLLTGVLTI